MSRLLHDFMLGAMLGDKESEDWALAMLWPGLEGETGQPGGEMQLASAPTVAPSPEYELEPMAAPGGPMVPGRSPAVSPPMEMRPPEPGPADPVLWREFLNQFGDAKWGPGGRLKRPGEFTDPFNQRWAEYVWQGMSVDQARARADQERKLLVNGPADRDSWMRFLDEFGDRKYDDKGRLKRWEDFTGRENQLVAWYVWKGAMEEEARRRAEREGELAGPEGPKNQRLWLQYLDQFRDAKYGAEGQLKRPDDFTDPHNQRVATYVWQGMSPGAAEARVQEEDRRAEALRQRQTMLARRGRSVGEAQGEGAAEVPGGRVPGAGAPEARTPPPPTGTTQRGWQLEGEDEDRRWEEVREPERELTWEEVSPDTVGTGEFIAGQIIDKLGGQVPVVGPVVPAAGGAAVDELASGRHEYGRAAGEAAKSVAGSSALSARYESYTKWCDQNNVEPMTEEEYLKRVSGVHGSAETIRTAMNQWTNPRMKRLEKALRSGNLDVVETLIRETGSFQEAILTLRDAGIPMETIEKEFARFQSAQPQIAEAIWAAESGWVNPPALDPESMKKDVEGFVSWGKDFRKLPPEWQRIALKARYRYHMNDRWIAHMLDTYGVWPPRLQPQYYPPGPMAMGGVPF